MVGGVFTIGKNRGNGGDVAVDDCSIAHGNISGGGDTKLNGRGYSSRVS